MIVLGFNYSKVVERSYAFQEFDQASDTTFALWDNGDVSKLYARYAVNPRGMHWFSNLVMGFDIHQESWGSDFTFSYAFSELKINFPKPDQGVFLRFFGGKVIDAEDAPTQDLIFLDGANPRARFRKFYLRSNGSIPEELHYHLPGGGNVRGYFNNPIIGDQLLALNVELRKEAPLGSSPSTNGAGEITFVTFADLAKMGFRDSNEEFFADMGFGVRVQRTLPDKWYTIFTGGRDITFRLDFPFWVSDPLPDERNFHFRWVFGFEQVF
jgi:hypothetical protein